MRLPPLPFLRVFLFMEKECKECKILFRVKPSHFSRRVVCSKHCQSSLYKKSMIGINNPNYKNKFKKEFTCVNCNAKFVKETRQKVRKTCSKECYLQNISKLHKGKTIFNKRQKTHITLDKMACKCGNKKDVKSNTCSECFKNNIKREYKKCVCCLNVFYPNTNRAKFCSIKCIIINKQNTTKGKDNPNWKGGIGSVNQIERRSKEFKDWRLSVFARDKYTCLDCGKIGGTLHAHHILPFAKYKELRFEITNGKTLCITILIKTNNL